MVLLLNEGIHIDDVLEELNNRLGISGHKEKSSRKKNKEK
jgi:phosphoribosyl-ATP pyrophosphohydrolase